MTRGEEHNIERAVGRIEAQNEIMAESLSRLVDQFSTVQEVSREMKADIAELKRRADLWAAVTEKFSALELAIHDGKLAAKFGTKGFLLGLVAAGGAIGALGVTGVKWLVATIWGA